MKSISFARIIVGLLAIQGGWTVHRCDAASAVQPISLSGQWRFALDPGDAGTNEQWFTKHLAARIKLPGVLQSQGYGDEISTNTPWVLTLYDRFWYLRDDYKLYTQPGKVKVPFLCQPPRHYLGPAWYQRDFAVPKEWKGKRVALFLERPHWESTVWVDDRQIGSCNSLVAPHEYKLGMLTSGKHRLSIRVDNRMILPYRPDGHSVSDSLDYSWNGIVGRIELTATSPVWIDDAQVYPNVATRSAQIQVRIGNVTGQSGEGVLSVGASTTHVRWEVPGGKAQIEVPLGENAPLWDEFNRNLHRLALRLQGGPADDTRQLIFGLREFKTAGKEFVINGRKTNLRGTHFGGDFPLTGYPATDVDSWKKILTTCQAWGLNHMRFHSWCPPEAAFTAADELGFYLQPECGMWNSFSRGDANDKMLELETTRMIHAYGNHPSFVMVSPSNEPAGRWTDVLPQWVSRWNGLDPRQLFTVNTGRVTPGSGASSQYQISPVRGTRGWFGNDFSAQLANIPVPVVAHELGQWCAYPNYDIIKKFSGYMRPGNYEIFRDSLAAHGLLGKNADFAWASGRFQLACYKEEIEANLRTPGFGGFQLLDLHDYVGQGTALVGLLDVFWQEKGYVDAKEFRGFCNTTVPLAWLDQRVYTTTNRFDVDIEVAHYGAVPLTNAIPSWKIVDAAGRSIVKGEWPAKTIPLGRNFALGKATADLSKLPAPAAYKLVVTINADSRNANKQDRRANFENHWNFWLYPAQVADSVPNDVLITSAWDEAEARLATGGKVLFCPRPADLGWTSPPLSTTPVFWNRLMNPGWTRMLGLWCDTRHPALAEFPTQASCDWQWSEIIRSVRAMNLDRLPRGLQPIVQAIDDWNRNWKLGLVYECKVGSGRLMVSTVNFGANLENRPVTRQLRRSLLDYMTSTRFQPKVAVTAVEMRGQLFDSRIMARLGATAEPARFGAASAIDGDPNTTWPAGARGAAPAPAGNLPHDLTITFPKPVPMNGVVIMPRQNDRSHLGDIRGYRIEVSDDAQQWREVHHGELASTWNQQQIGFNQTVTASRLRFTALSGFGPDSTVSLAELAVMYAGPKLADSGPGNIEYQRVRSTSTDVDEGPMTNSPRTNSPAQRPP